MMSLFLLLIAPAQGQSQPASTELIDAQSRQIIDEGLVWLAAQQNADGSFGKGNNYSQRVGVTALCGFAFLCHGSVPEAGVYSDHVERCLTYIDSCAKSNGYLVDSDVMTHGPMYGHGFATMFLAEVYGMTQTADVRLKLKKAVDLIIATQNNQGGWRYLPVADEADISVTACQMMALRAARNAGIAVPKEVIDRAVAYIKKCQNPDGGFRYRWFDPAESKFARSSAAIVALYTAGITDDPAIQQGFAYLNQRHQQADDLSYLHYAKYYQVQAYWHAGGERWSEIFAEIRDSLVEAADNGHWKDSTTGDEYATAMALIALQIPKNLVPIFER